MIRLGATAGTRNLGLICRALLTGSEQAISVFVLSLVQSALEQERPETL
jgi:hypothetical protein